MCRKEKPLHMDKEQGKEQKVFELWLGEKGNVNGWARHTKETRGEEYSMVGCCTEDLKHDKERIKRIELGFVGWFVGLT
jgi:hypothetical protein